MSKALLFFDQNGNILNQIYGDIVETEKIMYMTADVPEGKAVKRINTEDSENPQVEYENLPGAEIEELKHEVIRARAQTDAAKRRADTYIGIARTAASVLTDEQAVQFKELYPKWSELENGTSLVRPEEAVKGTEITRVLGDDGNLYKVLTTHGKQADWAPGVETASLFTVIDVDHAGTIDDPIPWAVNMVSREGKYYTYDNALYLCIRDSGIALVYTPDLLLGNYFVKV